VGKYGRVALPQSRVARLDEFERSRVERGSGLDGVQYRGEILPLVDVARALGTAPADEPPSLLQVVVHTEGGRSVGLVVDEIVDIVEEHVEVGAIAGRRGLLGSAVVQGRVTDLLDVPAVVAAQGLDVPVLAKGA
jgi:two-component system chemotaxis sensor kinase CheA